MTASGLRLLDRYACDDAGSPRAARARAWLEEHGLPTRRDEVWRYTPVDEILAALDDAVPAPAGVDGISRANIDEVAGDHGGRRAVFVNGVARRELSDDDPDDGLWLGDAAGLRARSPSPRPSSDQPADGFQALNWVAGTDVAAVVVAPDATVEAPVHVVHLSVPGSARTVAHPRTVLLARPGSRIHLIETFVGRPGAAATNASTRIVAGEGSSVTYQRIQGEDPAAIHVGRATIDQAAGSTLRATSIMVGGRIARCAVDVRFTGPDARVDVDGLYVPGGHQRHDTVVRVDHEASRCSSTQRFRGVVDEHGRGSFSGHVIVRPGTTGTDAHQSNRNLVLAPTAQADSRPWLEIFADDVRCTHGATVGRLDDDALLYLRSRGIPLGQARSMLIAAFTAAVLDDISPLSLRERVVAMAAAARAGSGR